MCHLHKNTARPECFKILCTTNCAQDAQVQTSILQRTTELHHQIAQMSIPCRFLSCVAAFVLYQLSVHVKNGSRYFFPGKKPRAAFLLSVDLYQTSRYCLSPSLFAVGCSFFAITWVNVQTGVSVVGVPHLRRNVSVTQSEEPFVCRKCTRGISRGRCTQTIQRVIISHVLFQTKTVGERVLARGAGSWCGRVGWVEFEQKCSKSGAIRKW